MKIKPSIKILVGYHKPAVLPNEDIFVPIHLGRALATEASKDGKISISSYQWMLDNMIGDDTGDNISKLNREFCELTALYWAWKNYDKLGNPDYIGFMHYRRYFILNKKFKKYNFTDQYNLIRTETLSQAHLTEIGCSEAYLNKIIDKNTCIFSSNKCTFTPEEYRKKHWACPYNDFRSAIDIANKLFPHLEDITNKYLNGHTNTWSQMFILNKQDFMSYCDWLFKILFQVHNQIDYEKYNIHQKRACAYIGETLCGIYANYLKKIKKRAVKSFPISFIKNTDIALPIEPVFNENFIPIVMATDKNYAPYLAVTLYSIVKNSTTDNKYDIIILEENLSDDIKEKYRLIVSDKKNISLRFYNMSFLMNSNGCDNLLTINHLKLSAYYRLFIANIMKNYLKAIYLDSDLIVNTSLEHLYNTDISNMYAAACKDMLVINTFTQPDFNQYLLDVLNIDNRNYYFNSGVLLLNLEKIRKDNLLEKMLIVAKKNNAYFHDQNVLNSVFYKKIVWLDDKYNVNWHLLFTKDASNFPSDIWNNYLTNLKDFYILHYTSAYKPWNSPERPNSYFWWKYARQTPFYEEIIYQNAKSNYALLNASTVKDAFNFTKNKIRYWRYKLLSKITLGNMRKHYKSKKKDLKKRLKQVKAFLKGK